ncbi:ATP-binding protein [Bacteroides sp. OttesenSCG-928-E20]|nr:ATP-binding protein [Bacteroides sp. OttesenSCG-928-N06]MDL2299102.1 ATP-binding protein [Bacteroides sp. OttesenSCG-928-E20]MDL2304127.1 ATP-binding protein [Bacteroides sp. OttesenSCG-928-D19]
MSTLSRNLPIGIQTFEKIREEGYLYVDKTALVHRLASTHTPYFLSRPRRFGKSLLLSTFHSFFEGRKDLFEGLAIAQLETEWKKYPVLHLDLNAEKYDSIERLTAILNRHLGLWEDTWGKEEREITLSDRFTGVIRRAYEQTGMEVVVLVDEYDKPLLQNLLNEPLLDEYRGTLKAFYGVLKSADRYLRFVFLTGVTKFAQVSVFSDLNQLSDISMIPEFATLCGITREELIEVFTPELERLGKNNELTFEETVEKMTAQYDGYHFRENTPGMFNPFSVLNTLRYLLFDHYWFQTGTPTYLASLLEKSDYDLRLLIEGVEIGITGFSEYRAETRNPIPMIYQSGYLTIKDYDKELKLYTLGFPNDEVRYGFLNFLTPYYTRVTDDETTFHIAHFVRELRSGDVPAFMKRMKAFFAGITYELSDDSERHYQVIFYIVFKLLGEFVQAEVRSATGRADAVVYTRDQIYVFEFKLNGTAEEAIRQIDEKGYLIPYTADGRKLVKVGVEFSKSERNISRFLVETN